MTPSANASRERASIAASQASEAPYERGDEQFGYVLSVLDEARELTWPALRTAVHGLTPSMQSIAGYQLGWLAADGTEEASDTGKCVRPALALLSARAAGRSAEVGLPGAMAVELVHNFSLLHDDLMDGDKERRHRPTAWAVFGSSAAILGGVALLTLAEQVLLDLGTSDSAAAAALLTTSTARLVTGQTHDLEFEDRDDVSLAECVTMAGDKTAALISCSAAIGAVLSGAPQRTIDALTGFGEHLGLAYQLVDDLLGIWGLPERTGKPVLADLRAGKKSLPVVAALQSKDPAAPRLRELLAPECTEPDRYATAAALIEDLGGRSWVIDEARRQLSAAYRSLDTAGIPAEARTELTAIADFVVSREL